MTSINTLDTPTLLLDIEKLEKNLDEIKRIASKNNIQWRPHIKTHKSVCIAKMQMERGAVGVTVAKLEEAEVMIKGGITNILVAYPISGPEKLHRLKKLTKKATVIVAIDSLEQAKLLNDAFQHTDKLTVWIKVNSGLNRCGVEGDEILPLAQALVALPNLLLTGIFTHAGHAYGAKNEAEIKKIAEAEATIVIESARLCEEAGITILHRSIGSTPTFKHGAKIKGITEIRPGNAAFYDMCQVGLGVTTMDRCAVTVLASVVSKKADRIIFDTGSKALALDQGAHGNKSMTGHGTIINHPEIELSRLSEEHGIASFKCETTLALNDKVEIIPNHSCVVANLFEEYVVHRNGEIIDTWRVDARGKMK